MGTDLILRTQGGGPTARKRLLPQQEILRLGAQDELANQPSSTQGPLSESPGDDGNRALRPHPIERRIEREAVGRALPGTDRQHFQALARCDLKSADEQQPCTVGARTVWIINPDVSPDARYFAVISGSTTDFARPFAMHYARDEQVNDGRLQEIQVRRLQFLSNEKDLPERQLWGIHVGVVP